MRNHYDILGVSHLASPEEIQEAYRRLVKKLHPDVSGGETSAAFLRVQEAWETLGDDQQRREYDRDRGMNPGPSFGETPTEWARPAGMPGPDELHFQLHMSLSEAALGGEVLMELPALQPCPHCRGQGQGQFYRCLTCGGEGALPVSQHYVLAVPPGLSDGTVMTLPLTEPGLVHQRLVIHVTVR